MSDNNASITHIAYTFMGRLILKRYKWLPWTGACCDGGLKRKNSYLLFQFGKHGTWLAEISFSLTKLLAGLLFEFSPLAVEILCKSSPGANLPKFTRRPPKHSSLPIHDISELHNKALCFYVQLSCWTKKNIWYYKNKLFSTKIISFV